MQDLTDVDVAADGGELLITRKLYASGRSSISLNGKPITLSMLRQVSEQLVDVHGQHDHQYLLKPANQLDVVDQFGNLFDLRARYRAVYDQLQAAQSRLKELSTNGDVRRQQLDLYQFQAKEIDAAQLDAAEYASLTTRASVLANLETLKTDAGSVHQGLYESDESLLDQLKGMAGTLDHLSGLDPQLTGIAAQVRDATITLEESAMDLSRYLNRLDLDPAELAETTDRLNTINRVLHKYTGDIESTVALRADLASEDCEAGERQRRPDRPPRVARAAPQAAQTARGRADGQAHHGRPTARPPRRARPGRPGHGEGQVRHRRRPPPRQRQTPPPPPPRPAWTTSSSSPRPTPANWPNPSARSPAAASCRGSCWPSRASSPRATASTCWSSTRSTPTSAAASAA